MSKAELSKKMVEGADKVLEGLDQIIKSMIEYDAISGSPNDDLLSKATSDFRADVQSYSKVRMAFALLNVVDLSASPSSSASDTEM